LLTKGKRSHEPKLLPCGVGEAIVHIGSYQQDLDSSIQYVMECT
jgi:hypothetical protein